MNQMPIPSESKIKGSVNSISNGFSTALNKLSNSTTTASVVPLS